MSIVFPGSVTGSVLEEQFHDWDLVLLLSDGSEYVLDQWTQISVAETIDGASCGLEVNGLEPPLAYVRELVTDILFYRDRQLRYRMRVVDSEDSFTRDAYIVSFECVTYERLLARRILHDNWVLIDQDTDAAWRLIEYTQARQTLGITRGQAGGIGPQRQRSLGAGDSILAAINAFAEAENGFDWWIDQNRVFWVQKPRRGKTHDVEWTWGNEVAEATRTSPVEDYASVVMAVGAQNETKIPDPPNPDRIYPPPPPQTVTAPTQPFGLWETAVSYSDVITTPSLLEKANWHLGQRANIRPTYKLVLEPGIWNPSYAVGDIVTLRIAAPPRLNIRVPVRFEEIQITMSADGEEQVSMSARAEEPETYVTPSPIGPYPIVPTAPPSGRSVAQHRLHPWDDLAGLIRGVDERLGRQERHPSA